MRTCPVCGEFDARALSTYPRKPDWPILLASTLYECAGCGFHYLESAETSQANYDEYYRKYYKIAEGYEPDNLARLAALALTVAQHCPDFTTALDIGGENGILAQLLWDSFGIPCNCIGPGEAFSGAYDPIILSHTLEHIYDLDGFMRNLNAAVVPGVTLLIEVPVWRDDYSDPAGYDDHIQHVNKWTSHHLGAFLVRHGWAVAFDWLPDFREYRCLRAGAVKL